MTVTDAIEGAIEVTKGLNEIKSSNLAFAKEALQITAQAGEAITPFIPLIGLAATAIVEIINIYQTSQYNKRICNSLLDRARLSEIAIDQLIRRRKENEKNFKSQVWYHAFNRFVVILGKIKTFAEKVSQLQGFKVYFKARSVSEKFNLLMDDYDNAMKDLNFTMAIANDQQRQIDSESLKADLSEMNEFLEKIGDNIEENSIKMSLIYEEVQNIKSMISKSEINETKRIDSNKLTEPVVGRQSDTRGFRGRTKRRIYMNAIEVACRAINIPEEDSPDYKITQRFLAICIKATQSPNIIQFYGLSIIDGATVMVLEWAELGSLRELYKENKIPLIPLKLKLSYALDICRGVAYLNALNIYHHDLKCSNVMVTERNVAKLTNFYFSRGKDHTSTSMAGRIEDGRWLAPEKLIDPKYRYDHKCEIFSFGMLLWELTFERKPYEDMELEDILDHVISGEREKIQFENSLALPDSSDAKIQKGFEEIIKEAWNQDPNIRISITKLLIQLDDLSKKYVKPGCSPGLEPQEIANFDIPSNSLNDKGDEIPDDVDFSNIDVDFEPLIPISEGVKAYKEKNHEKAWKCFNEQAENQNSLGKYWKAFYLWGGLFNQKDKLAALALYKEAADDGITDAQYRYAFALLDKDIKSKIQTNSKEESVKYLRIAAENGSGSAQFQIGEGYYNGNLGYAQNLEMAKLWYKRAALKDDKKAKERLKALGVND
ncbi:kinase-like protein [Rhizophagus irregularis]|uniref:Kinase-like protein n=2 Tax=Rhizophagus irregularis TaxID=588596 RepID=A0A2N0PRT1_9GLOM|nr:kinase-like protein [Rhizophagus irregularis]CAB4396639.1 unnamed protein product [Rhizophagus irregularis]CAB4483795.1 unnamed protein product [Rhizophagus irregularis]CAB5216028.1 unnamed protein product [Rhizophagus irregularis]CAB5344327.1 unnamed protein product [Rhizophagus irregularis]